MTGLQYKATIKYYVAIVYLSKGCNEYGRVVKFRIACKQD